MGSARCERVSLLHLRAALCRTKLPTIWQLSATRCFHRSHLSHRNVCLPESDSLLTSTASVGKHMQNIWEVCGNKSGLMSINGFILPTSSDCSTFCFRAEPDAEMTLVLSMNPLLDSEGDPPPVWDSERCRKTCLSDPDPACSSEQQFTQGAHTLFKLS